MFVSQAESAIAGALRIEWSWTQPRIVRELTRRLALQRRPLSIGKSVTVRDNSGKPVTVAAAERSEEAVHLFMSGQCHAFAFAVHEVTGWPIVWATRFPGHMPPEPQHILVLHPSDVLVDIRGVRGIDQTGSEIGEFGALNASVLREIGSCAWARPELALARSFVVPTLELIDLQLQSRALGAPQPLAVEWKPVKSLSLDAPRLDLI